MEILNRREQIGANNIPPEIPDVDTLVTKTDYATASKAGVVKIGNNINVSNGKISVPAASDETAGVVKIGENLSIDESGALNASGGITVDVLWEGRVTNDYKNITSELAHPITDYAFLTGASVSGVNVNGGNLLLVSAMSTGTNNSNYIYVGSNNFNIRLGENTVSIAGSTADIKLIGIK